VGKAQDSRIACLLQEQRPHREWLGAKRSAGATPSHSLWDTISYPFCVLHPAFYTDRIMSLPPVHEEPGQRAFYLLRCYYCKRNVKVRAVPLDFLVTLAHGGSRNLCRIHWKKLCAVASPERVKAYMADLNKGTHENRPAERLEKTLNYLAAHAGGQSNNSE